MGLPGLMIDIVGSGPGTTLDTARQMSLMIDGGYLSSWLFTSRSRSGDYIEHGPIDDCNG